MDVSDSNLDGVLDYKEFCEMDTRYKWLFTRYIVKYVEIGKGQILINHFHDIPINHFFSNINFFFFISNIETKVV